MPMKLSERREAIRKIQVLDILHLVVNEGLSVSDACAKAGTISAPSFYKWLGHSEDALVEMVNFSQQQLTQGRLIALKAFPAAVQLQADIATGKVTSADPGKAYDRLRLLLLDTLSMRRDDAEKAPPGQYVPSFIGPDTIIVRRGDGTEIEIRPEKPVVIDLPAQEDQNPSPLSLSEA